MHVASSPSSEEHPLLLFFAFTFLAARERIWITTPYFVPDPATRKILADRARDGVDVRILLPNDHTDAKPIRWTSHRYYEPLLAAGVRIWEYQPTMIHTKAVVADGMWSVVGSANMDIRSRELNEENVMGVFDETFGAKLERTFEGDLQRSREIRLEEWRRRGPGARLLERMAALLEEQY
jgi:cardiolipin synthase